MHATQAAIYIGYTHQWLHSVPVPFLTIYLGGAIAPPGKEFAPPVKPFLPPKCEAELQLIYLIMRLCPSIASSTAILCVIHIVLRRVFHNSDIIHANNPIKCWFQEE